MTSLALYLLDLTLQVSLLIGVALAVLPLLRRQPAALRHWVLSVAIACAVCVPLCRAIVPDWTLAEVAAPGDASSSPARVGAAGRATCAAARLPATVAGPSGSGAAAVADVTRLVLVTWVSGTVAGLLILAAGLARLAWLGRRARPLTDPAWVARSASRLREFGIRRPVRLLETDRPGVLAAWGWLRPRVMVPRWRGRLAGGLHRGRAPSRTGAYRTRRLGRADSPPRRCARSTGSTRSSGSHRRVSGSRANWPATTPCWTAALGEPITRRNCWRSHVPCARTVDGSPSFPAPAMARSSSLERRVTAMLNTRLSRAPMGLASRIAIVCLAAAITLPVAGLAVFAQGAGQLRRLHPGSDEQDRAEHQGRADEREDRRQTRGRQRRVRAFRVRRACRPATTRWKHAVRASPPSSSTSRWVQPP